MLLLWLTLLSPTQALADLVSYDFTGKVAGSTVENPHVAYTITSATPDGDLVALLAQASEFDQTNYDGVEVDDTTYASYVASSFWGEVGDGSASGGGISNNNVYSYLPSLALDDSGNPYMAWQDYTSNNWEIYVRRFDGTNWVEVGAGSASGGGISNNSGSSESPSLALDGSGNPYVAWRDDSGGNMEIYLKRFDGANWIEVGAGSASGGGISNNGGRSLKPSLALDGSGNPYVAWHDDSGGDIGAFEIYVIRFDGTNWVEVGAGSATDGGISDNNGVSVWPSLELNGSANPYVAWTDRTSGYDEIYVKRFDGTSWVEVGTGSASGGGISNHDWSYHPSLALDESGNPYVAWYDYSGFTAEIYVKLFDGNAWQEVGAGSASGGGISNNDGQSFLPSLALDGSGNPYVAWDDDSGGDAEIYIKRFDSNSWVEVGVGSASGGGISNNGGISESPSLALDGSGNPYVAWHDTTGGDHDIYIKRWVNQYSEHLYAFQLEDVVLEQLTPSLWAYGTSEGGDGVSVMIWNQASSSWESVGSNTTSVMPDSPIIADFTTNPEDYLDNTNKVYLLARTTNPSSASGDATLYVDYVKLDVVYKPVVESVSITPPSPLMAESVEFEVIFSEAMNTAIPPTVTFGLASPYDSYVVTPKSGSGYTNGYLDTDPSKWYGDFTFTTEIPNGTYTLSISGAEGVFANQMLPDASTTFLYDTVLPTGSIVIDSDATYTTDTDVTLTLSATDENSVSQMRFSNDSTSWSEWEAYATSKAWPLSSGDGTKTVYVEYKDNPGNVSTIYSDDIVLDTVLPTGSIIVDNGATYTNDTEVTLTLSASDANGVAQMRISNDGMSWSDWEVYATSKAWSLSSGDGTKTVYVEYKDNAGNGSIDYNDDIILDVTPPNGAVDILPNGDNNVSTGSITTTRNTIDYPYRVNLPLVMGGALLPPNVTLLLTATDDVSGVGYMMISNDANFARAVWEPYATTKPWHVNETGSATVYVKYKDNAGNVSPVYSDTIVR